MKTNRFLAVAAISIALAFIFFACSSDGGDGNGDNNFITTSSSSSSSNNSGPTSCSSSIATSSIGSSSSGVTSSSGGSSSSTTSGGSSSSSSDDDLEKLTCKLPSGSCIKVATKEDCIQLNGLEGVSCQEGPCQEPSIKSSSSSFSITSGSSSSSVIACSQQGIILGDPVVYGGETYETIVICSQTWLKRNLNVKHNTGNGNSWCYNNQSSYCNTYGRLYNWAAAMDLPSCCNKSSCASLVQSPHQGICPEGFHIPTNAEWDALYRFVDGTSGTESPYLSYTAGGFLKSASGWASSGSGGNDEYGFSALPGGKYNYTEDGGYFSDIPHIGVWWRVDEYISQYAYYSHLYYYNKQGTYSNDSKPSGLSVRCLKD
jgi:uncharacterized protein (TIGR02145 family)